MKYLINTKPKLNKLHGEIRRDYKYYNKRSTKYILGYLYYLLPIHALKNDIVLQLRKMLLMNQGRQIKTRRIRNRTNNKTINKNM